MDGALFFASSAQRTKQRLQEASEVLLNLDQSADDALQQSYNKDFLKTITRTVYQNEDESEEEVEEVRPAFKILLNPFSFKNSIKASDFDL